MEKRILILMIISIAGLFLLSACQDGKQAQQPAASANPDAASDAQSASMPASNSEESGAVIPDTTAGQESSAQSAPAKSCRDECESITAWCQGSSLYACIQEAECKGIKVIKTLASE